MGESGNFMEKNYRIALQPDPDGSWMAENPELPGCKADGETAQEALASLDVARRLWIESREAAGLPIPEPQETADFSGKFVLRIPKSLHRDLACEAESEGVSLNSYVSNILAARRASAGSSSMPYLENMNALYNLVPGFTMTHSAQVQYPDFDLAGEIFVSGSQMAQGIYPRGQAAYDNRRAAITNTIVQRECVGQVAPQQAMASGRRIFASAGATLPKKEVVHEC